MQRIVYTIIGDFNEHRYKKLKRLYERAISLKEEQFDFDGQPILVGFAKYFLEYLEEIFKDKNKRKEKYGEDCTPDND